MKPTPDRLFEYLVPDMPRQTERPADSPETGDETAARHVKLVRQFAKVMAISDKYQADVADTARELRLSKEELERTQTGLIESEQRFRALTDNLPVGVAMIGPQGEILAVNAKMKAWFPETEAKPKDACDRVARDTPPEDADDPCLARRALRDGRTHTVEREVSTGLGRRCLDITATPVHDANGRIASVIEMVEDITARKRTEAEMRASEAQDRHHQKAESLARMAAAIAHHFNNQLQSVMGNLELAMEDLPEGNRSVTRLNSAMLAARKAAEMSALMRAYLGQESVTLEPTDLSGICRENLAVLENALPQGFSVRGDLPESGPVINGKAGHIEQILISLVTNAREAMEEDGGGDVRLSVSTVAPHEIPHSHRFPIDWQSGGTSCGCLEVTDTGKGIDPADLDKIFDPFFSNKFTGRGLGLSVVLGMVRAHNGVITVDSEPGRGSRFRCFFPLAQEQPVRKPIPDAGPSADTPGGTVLVVEDEKGVRTMAAQMLKRLGFEVLEAEDGSKAVEIFRRERSAIICVLCDVSMPRMDGWDTLTALRKMAPDLPVILSSGYDEGSVMDGEHAELPQGFIKKPFDLEHLKNAIARATTEAKD